MSQAVPTFFSKIKSTVINNKSFLFLWISQVFTESAVSIINILIGILSDEGTLSTATKDSASGIGLILVFALLPGLIFAPIGGVVADWFSRKIIMITANVVRFLLIVGFILIRGWTNRWISYGLIFSLSVALQFFIPAAGGLTSTLVQKKYMLFANSLFSITVYGMLAVGLVFAGLSLNIFGVERTFLIAAILFVFSTALLSSISDPSKRKKKKVTVLLDIIKVIKSLLKSLKVGLVYSFKKPLVRYALIHMFLLQIVGLIIATLVFRIGSEIYGVSARSAGLVVFSPLVIGLLVGLVFLNTFGRKKNRIQLIWWGTLVSFFGLSFMLVISWFRDSFVNVFFKQVVSTLSLLFVGATIPFLLIPGQTIIHENTKEKFRGRVLGVMLALTSSIASIVASVFGVFTDAIGDISFPLFFIVISDILYSLILYFVFIRKKL
jgi:MFS family permease